MSRKLISRRERTNTVRSKRSPERTTPTLESRREWSGGKERESLTWICSKQRKKRGVGLAEWGGLGEWKEERA